jgi:hypothetical protein
MSSIKLGFTVVGFLVVHFSARAFSARVIAKQIVTKTATDKNLAGDNREGKILAGNIKNAFLKNTQPLRSVFRPMPVGWSMRSKRTLLEVTADACEFIQTMNDRYTKPSGASSTDKLSDKEAQLEDITSAAEQGATVEALKTVKQETS